MGAISSANSQNGVSKNGENNASPQKNGTTFAQSGANTSGENTGNTAGSVSNTAGAANNTASAANNFLGSIFAPPANQAFGKSATAQSRNSNVNSDGRPNRNGGNINNDNRAEPPQSNMQENLMAQVIARHERSSNRIKSANTPDK